MKSPPDLPLPGNVRAIAASASAADRTDAEGAPLAEGPAAEIASCAINGIPWTFRSDRRRVLEAVPAAAWSDPAGQGWRCVKRNSARTVWRAPIVGNFYYVKYYAGRQSSWGMKRLLRGPACEREFRSGVYALTAGIPAVRPVACTEHVRSAGRRISVLVTEAVEPACPLPEFWTALRTDDDSARQRRDTGDLIDQLARMIAHAHQSGLQHHDLHAANILVHTLAPRTYETVFVDLQNACCGRPLGDRAVIRNLAQLNQWFRRNSGIGDRLRFLRRYLRWRHEFEQLCEHSRPLGMSFVELVHALAKTAERHAERLWAKRDRRARRNGRYFSRIALSGGWRGYAFVRCKRPAEESRASTLVLERDWWQTQLEHPLRWFETEGSRPCKDSHSALVLRALLSTGSGELPVIVKRPRARNRRRRLRQFLAPSRSARGWQTANALLNREIPTARPLAMLERRLGPLVFDSLLLTEALPGALDLETHLRREYQASSPNHWRRHKRELGELLARHARQLAERRFVHRDCKAQNLLVVAQPRLKLLWVDLDGLKRVRHPSPSDQLRALTRLHVSLLHVPGLTRTDRARFLRAYLARFGSDPDAWRDAWRAISLAGAIKIRAREVRRQWKLKHYGRA